MFSIELLAGLLIGWVLCWIVDAKYWRPKIEAEGRELQYENRTLQRRLDKTQDERDAATQAKLKAEQALGGAEAKAKEAVATRDELMKKAETAQADSHAARKELEKLNKERDTLSTGAKENDKALAAARKATEEAQAAVGSLEAQLAEAKKSRKAEGKASAAEAENVRGELAEAQSRNVQLQAELDAIRAKADEANRLRAENDALKHKLETAGSVPSAAPVEAESPVAGDDLEKIRGIGKVFARRLNDAGIYTHSQLVAASPDELRDAAGIRTMRTVDPTDWVRQAEDLLAGGEADPS